MIEVERLRHRYGAQTVLALEHWQARAGEHWALIGMSGSGKTTLLHAIAGLVRPSEGEVRVDGTALGALGPRALDAFRGRTVGLVPQRLHLIGSLRVRDNLALAQRLAGREPDPARIDAMLAILGIADKAASLPRSLSQGQAQRAAIARAVVNAPKVLLADEPTANLDDRNAADAIAVLVEAARACSATLVVATHDARVKQRFERRLELPGEARA